MEIGYGNVMTFKSNKTTLSKEKVNRTFYSDRLWQWDHDKYNKIATKWFGRPIQMYYGINPEILESFLKDYFAEDLVLVSIEINENSSNGYPIWRFDCCMKNLK